MLEILESYQCERFEIMGLRGLEVYPFSGGGLSDAIEKQGLQPLITLLGTVSEIRATDLGNQIILKRAGEQTASITYRWKDGSQYQQVVPLKPPNKNLPEKEKPQIIETEEEDSIEDFLPEPKKHLQTKEILPEPKNQLFSKDNLLLKVKEEQLAKKETTIVLLEKKLVFLEEKLREEEHHKEELRKEGIRKEKLYEEKLREEKLRIESAQISIDVSKEENNEGTQVEEGYMRLGRKFCEKYGVVAPYVAGAMAGGIASVQLVQAMSRAGMLAFFGSGGLPLDQIQNAMQELAQEQNIWGCNLLHNPNEPIVEDRTVDILLHFGVRMVSASAFIRLTKALIRYRYAGIEMIDGKIHCPNQVFAKISHPSIAERFLSPPPQNLLLELLREGVLRQEQVMWAKRVPVASALIVEGDSGGHTDSRPLAVIFPTIRRIRDRMMKVYQFEADVLMGAAGGLGEPSALNAAYAMGADFAVIGSVHQSTVEAGTSPKVKELLASATIIDCAMGAAPDMFEQGAHVQVFSKNNFYATRSKKLFNIYKQYPGIFEIPRPEIDRLERQIFQASLQQVWNEVQRYWQERDPQQLERANREPKHQMALMFRWYLGQSSRWAREGNLSRIKDYQIWCGPAIGAFNTWAKGTPFERPENRKVAEVAFALLDEVLKC